MHQIEIASPAGALPHTLIAPVLLALALCASTTLAQPPRNFTGDVIQAVAIADSCATANDACSALGASGAAEWGNDSPIGVVVQLIRPNGDPVTGLTAADFAMDQGTGAPLQIVTCPPEECFDERPDGLYAFLAQPLGAWQGNIHAYRVEATLGATTMYTLVRFEIPGQPQAP